MKKEKGIAAGKIERDDTGDETLDSLRLYFHDIRKSQLLTPEELIFPAEELLRHTVNTSKVTAICNRNSKII